MAEESAVVEPLTSRKLPSSIPVSEHIYIGVSAEVLDRDMYELSDYLVHGVFDGTTLKMSNRAKREASPGPSRRILDQSDLDQYCTGL